MKSAAFLLCSAFFVLLVTVELDSIDDIGLRVHGPSHVVQNQMGDPPVSILESAKHNLQTTIAFADREKRGHDATEKIPITILLMTGLFGFAFWGRSSFNGRKDRQ